MGKILFVVATRPEWDLLKKRGKWNFIQEALPFYELAQLHPIHLCQIGIGRKKVEQFAKGILQKVSPELVLHFGVSGGLHPDLKIGNLFLPDSIVNDKGNRNKIDADLLKRASRILKSLSIDFQTGPLFTSREVLYTPEQKEQMAKQTGAKAVDMESFFVAEICEQEKIPYLSLRAIFDSHDQDISNLDGTVDADGLPLYGKMIQTVVKRPNLVMELAHYRKVLAQCNQALAGFLGQVMKEGFYGK